MKHLYLAGLAISAIMPSCCTAQQKSPNIILIMADDLGWGDVGFNGNTWIKTPYLDSMARNGVVFSHFYSASSVSSPTRASVLTGRNPYRTGVFDANTGILRPEEITIPEILQKKGYRTGHFGKWHLGSLTYSKNDANRGRIGNVKEYNPPILHGYDYAFVTESKVPTWDPMRKPIADFSNKGWRYLESDDDWVPYGTSYWDINGCEVTDNLAGDDSRVIMDRVIPFIDNSLDSDSPFLVTLWFHAPHMPCVAGPEYCEKYKNLDFEKQNYAGCISAMDDQIGRLLKYLEEREVVGNTIILFCSDNGPEVGSPGETGLFIGRKHSMHEGGIRVPSFIYWEGTIRPSVIDLNSSTMDYLPTIVELANADKALLTNVIDGKSLVPVLHGNDQTAKSITMMRGHQMSSIEGQYKLLHINGKYKLYDIVKDPSESFDLSSTKQGILNRMISMSQNFIGSCKQSFLGNEYGPESFEKLNQTWKEVIK